MSHRISITEGRKILRDQATHREIQSAIEQYLDAQAIPYASTDAAEAFNRSGQRIRRVTPDWPDITACLPPSGLLFPIEVKTARDRLRPGQARTLHVLASAGALVCVARSVDDVIETRKQGATRKCDFDEIARYKDKIKRPTQAKRWRVKRSYGEK